MKRSVISICSTDLFFSKTFSKYFPDIFTEKIILCRIENLSHFTLMLKKLWNKENDVRIKYEKKKKKRCLLSFERSEDILDICRKLADQRRETRDTEPLEGKSNRSDSPQSPECHCKPLLGHLYLDATEWL